MPIPLKIASILDLLGHPRIFPEKRTTVIKHIFPKRVMKWFPSRHGRKWMNKIINKRKSKFMTGQLVKGLFTIGFPQ